MSVQSLRHFILGSSVLVFAAFALGQSTSAIQGTVTDASGRAIPNALVMAKDPAHGVDRTQATDSAGIYYVPALPVGTYSVEVKAMGMAVTEAKGIVLDVGMTVKQDFALTVASSSQIVEVKASGALVDTSTASLTSVVDEREVQEIPLNGRHFVDLAQLTTGTVQGPANGNLTVPLRGQGTFSFNSAGGREDTVNFMVNGINMNDSNNQQVTFQPTINTVDEFIVDNSTFSAEYGRNSGSIVNVATRPGVNTWHGEAYDFLRNADLDARNYTNPANLPKAEFIRNQFGGDGGGAIKKDKTFVYLSYEALRQRQAYALSATTLTVAQFAQAAATSDAAIKALLPLIPLPNSGTNQYVFTAPSPVNIQQGTVNFSQIFSPANRLNIYYAIQQDFRGEPPTTDGNSFPNEGDNRGGRRQLISLNESSVISPSLVNEVRAGANRIHIVFNPDVLTNPQNYNINDGVTTAIGLPEMSISGGFTFGSSSISARGDLTDVLADTLSWVHGKHTIRLGGEERRQNSNNISTSPGTFGFSSVAAFLADTANSFSTTTSNLSNRSYENAVGLFATDSWKAAEKFTVTLGLRYEWNSTPTEGGGRYVVFNPANDTLQHVGSAGGPANIYNESALNFEPRVGFAFDPFGKGRTIIRSAYAIMTDEPGFGLVTGLVNNPPYAIPISSTVSGLTLLNAYSLVAGGSISPRSVAHNYKDAYVQQWNFGIDQQLTSDFKITARYVGSKGTDLNVGVNPNQFVNGLRPFPALSASSPIDPGVTLSNITVQESIGNSSYNALWVTAEKRFGKGLQFNASYSWSKSIDENSRNYQGVVIQDSNNIRGDRGLSDFDARNRIVISGIYELPFKGNRLKEGWQISLVETTQSGNPLNFHTADSAFTGSANLRPDVTAPVITGFSPATNGSATSITYIQNPGVFIYPGNVFGTLGRNVIEGPGYSDLDIAVVKNTRITERLRAQIRFDAFDSLNQVNFNNPTTSLPTPAGGAGSAFVPTSSSTFGVITAGTRYAPGDFGTSRQIQLSIKLIF
jgi:Carboxypeptidase regulatory-like domain